MKLSFYLIHSNAMIQSLSLILSGLREAVTYDESFACHDTFASSDSFPRIGTFVSLDSFQDIDTIPSLDSFLPADTILYDDSLLLFVTIWPYGSFFFCDTISSNDSF